MDHRDIPTFDLIEYATGYSLNILVLKFHGIFKVSVLSERMFKLNKTIIPFSLHCEIVAEIEKYPRKIAYPK